MVIEGVILIKHSLISRVGHDLVSFRLALHFGLIIVSLAGLAGAQDLQIRPDYPAHFDNITTDEETQVLYEIRRTLHSARILAAQGARKGSVQARRSFDFDRLLADVDEMTGQIDLYFDKNKRDIFSR